MPSSTSGLTGTEIVSFVKSWIGNQDAAFQTFVETILPLAEFRFCKIHNWGFLHQSNRSLTVSSGTQEYALSVSSVGYYIAAEDVKSVFSTANGVYLKKVTLEELRRLDPQIDDGNSSAKLQYWAPAGDNRIAVYPPTFADTTLKIDGKVTPAALLTLSNYPTIPFRFQDAFIEYVLALALARENDDRAQATKASALALIRQDIAADLSGVGDVVQPRFKHVSEQQYDGTVGQIDPLNMLFTG